jgi:DeoR/GlpR family transcriptional regulator of sugar metabolism
MSHSDLMTSERQQQIAQMVMDKGRLTVAAISELFNVSEATARRDLAALAALNLIQRVHGGAMKRRVVATSETPILRRQTDNAEAKQRIGQAAARLIDNGETLLLIGGSTGLAVAHELYNHQHLTIVTDSLLIASELLQQGQYKIIILGGTIDRDEQAVRGTLSRIVLEQLQVDKAIIGTKAASPDWGLSVETPEEAELWRAYIAIAHHVILVTDSSKFRQSALVHVTAMEDIHTLVTDKGIDEEIYAQLQDKGVYVIIA